MSRLALARAASAQAREPVDSTPLVDRILSAMPHPVAANSAAAVATAGIRSRPARFMTLWRTFTSTPLT
jgi:hypothetical protein